MFLSLHPWCDGYDPTASGGYGKSQFKRTVVCFSCQVFPCQRISDVSQFFPVAFKRPSAVTTRFSQHATHNSSVYLLSSCFLFNISRTLFILSRAFRASHGSLCVSLWPLRHTKAWFRVICIALPGPTADYPLIIVIISFFRFQIQLDLFLGYMSYLVT